MKEKIKFLEEKIRLLEEIIKLKEELLMAKQSITYIPWNPQPYIPPYTPYTSSNPVTWGTITVDTKLLSTSTIVPRGNC